jgi:hypothetical protein
MKKIFAIIFAMVMASAVFAEARSIETYTVTEVTGTVRYESAKGVYEEVKVGIELTPSTVIKTNLNSKLTVLFKGVEYKIPPKQSGQLDMLCIAFSPNIRKGLKKQTIAKSDAVDTEGVREGVATASARASEAKEDFTWDE